MGAGASSRAGTSAAQSKDPQHKRETDAISEQHIAFQNGAPPINDILSQKQTNNTTPTSDESSPDKGTLPTLSRDASAFILKQQANQFDHDDPTKPAPITLDEKNRPVIAATKDVIPTASVNIHELQAKQDGYEFAHL
mmetsp:Transcript_20114/g.33879  ORF Transcript_20114/g.33879 Transcript_20114/m.33879 type:complete len:138 (-) Transcript_20114:25-438(-)|eukprot:CAMPEP_0114424484 /NCGR_PEP_ID=MMETSP0103-20121206/6717_1 /TAXON_ID=37642 ORGANISM="Paraphysomonas imperforata, Strain PA2" /NCGR_SAMPLE_ID=MMETSP0103 /ASSEMBLY_ACC=CAM_ASM_000201 /LENGTH=137 /DNA_ID=CAMNT_0001593237 /DNA_START=22 /DNA_END=435 /DNA_ORIENTATION=-